MFDGLLRFLSGVEDGRQSGEPDDATFALAVLLIEVARSLGASSWSVFRRVILPLSLPGLAAGIVLVFVPVVGSFMEPRILGGQAGMMLGTVIEDQFTEVFNWPLGAALSFILLVIELASLAIFYPLLRRRL